MRAIREELQYTDFNDARRFYKQFMACDPRPKDVAFLCCNDRFFLLTGILNRKDALASVDI